MTTDTSNTIERALASLHKKPSDDSDQDTVLATTPAVSFVDLAANNPAHRTMLYSD